MKHPAFPAQRNILILMEWYDHRIRQGIGQYASRRNWHLTVDERALIPRGWAGDGLLTVFHRGREVHAIPIRARSQSSSRRHHIIHPAPGAHPVDPRIPHGAHHVDRDDVA